MSNCTSAHMAAVRARYAAERGFTDAEALALIDGGMTRQEVQERFGCSHFTMIQIGLRNGRDLRLREFGNTGERDAEVVRLTERGLTRSEVGDEIGITKNAVCGIVARMRARGTVFPETSKDQAWRAKNFGDKEAVKAARAARSAAKKAANPKPPRPKRLRLKAPATKPAATAETHNRPRRERPGNPFMPRRNMRPVTLADEALIAQFIAERGVTKLPTAALDRTTGTIRPEESAALAVYRKQQEDAWEGYGHMGAGRRSAT